MPPPRRFLRRDALAAIGFVATLWLIASGGVYGFALGRYSDDWAYILRTPDGSGLVSPFVRYDYFFRPLFFVAVYAINTLGGAGAWPAHLLAALAHLGAALLLLRLLMTLGVGPGAAALCAGLFVAWDVQHEAVLWSASLGLPAGMCLAAGAMLSGVALAREGGATALKAGRAIFGTAVLGITAFLAACWHEQPAAAACATPLVMLAARPPGQPWPMALRRAALAGLGLGAGCLAYIALLIGTTPAGARGSGASLVRPEDLPARVGGVFRAAADLAVGDRAAERTAGALELGESVLRSSGAGVLLLALAAVASGAWIAWAWGLARDRRVQPRDNPAPSHAGLIALAGLAIVVLSLLPIAAVRNNFVFARYLYPAVFGLALALGPVADLLSPRGDGRGGGRVARIVALAAAAAGLMALASAMVGMQAAFRARDALDRSIAEQLRALAPIPERDAVFIPIGLRDDSPTGRGFDRAVASALHLPWAAAPMIARAYGRADLSATHWRPGQRPQVAIEAAGVRYPRGLRDVWARPSPQLTFIPFDRAVLFTVDAGRVRLVTPDEARDLVRAASN